MASHTVLRSRVFHYNRAVPEDVQPFVGLRWWKVSLKTGDKREAEVKAREIAVAHDRLIAGVRSKTERQRLEELETAAAELRQRIVGGFDKRLAAVQAAVKADGIEALRIGSPTQIKLAAKSKQSLTAQRGYQQSHSLIADYAVPAIQRERQGMLADATERLATLTESDRTAAESFGGIEALFYSTVSQEPPSDGDDSDDAIVARHRLAQRKTLLRKLGIDVGGASDSNNPRVNSAMEQWFKERKQGDAAVKRHRTSIKRFTELRGNIPVGDVTKDMVRSYIKAIENLPDHRRLPTNMRGGLADPEKDVPRVAAPTVDRHLVSIKALLTFCVEQDWLKVNVATALKAPKDTRPKGSRRRSFTREERQQFLVTVVEAYGTDGDVTWFVRLVAYTGGRLEEIAQLARKNIKSVDGIWIVEVDDLDGRTIKEEPKQIPIHPAIRDDFLAWYVGYRELAEKLTAMGTPETDRNIANKISRGGFMRPHVVNGQQGLELFIQFKNSGQTPGYRFSTWRDKRIDVAAARPFTEPPPIEQRGPTSIIGPGATVDLTTYIVPANTAAGSPLLTGAARIFIWGQVDYLDIYEKPRHFKFKCWNSDHFTNNVWGMSPHPDGYEAN